VVQATEGAGAPSACFRCRRPLDLSGSPQDVDAAALVSALRASPAPVLVDFSSDAPPSEALLEQARAFAGSLLVLHVDPAAEPAAAQAFSVGAGPTLVLFEGGAEVARHPGSAAWPDLGAALGGAAAPGTGRRVR
jgi:thioredoxin-like negative regulator of GroEL